MGMGIGPGLGWEWGQGWDGSGDRAGVQLSPWPGPPALLGGPAGFYVSRSKGTRAGGFSCTYEGRKRTPGEPMAVGHTMPAMSALFHMPGMCVGGSAPFPLLATALIERSSFSSPPPQSCEPGADFLCFATKIGNRGSIPWGSDPPRETEGWWGLGGCCTAPPRPRHSSDGRPA